MKTKFKFRLKKSLLLNLLFFVNIFVFASFTKEDRLKVRAFKLKMMDKYIYHYKEEASAIKNIGKTNNFKKYNASSEVINAVEKKKVEFPVAEFSVPENNSIDNSFEAEEKQGIIGEFSDDESDNATDNFFTINIPEIKDRNMKAYLVYDLLGLGSSISVSRSINKNIAFGGGIIVPGSKWSMQKEEISLSSLKEGKNSILFTSSANGIKYKVKDVKIVFENKRNDDQDIFSLLSGDQLYIKGTENGAYSSVNINNKSIPVIKGEYETLIKLSEEDKTKGFVNITGANGIKEYPIPRNIASFKVINEEKFSPLILNISKEAEYKENYENTTISIEKNSTADVATIQVLKLRKKDYPSVSRDIKNLTVNSYAYRVETQSGELTKKVKFSFPYDDKKLGARSAKDIKAFYFDYASKKWKVDPTSVVDTEKKIITVENKGDGDYINGVISVPESSPLAAFAPTSISGLKAADPTAGLQIIAPPTATQKGDANVSYPIVIPSGRNGLQPNLSLSYNSSKGNGWMGEGWDISGISFIEVDTRWGSPQFDPANESELYSLNGEMLVYENDYMPHRHTVNSGSISTVMQTRNTTGVKTFYLRTNHDFSKIERYGDSPANYRWVITSTNGNKTYYGGDENSLDTTSVLFSISGNIVKWGIYKVEDPYRNNIKFYYDNLPLPNQSGENANLSGGRIFNIKSITYTGKDGNDGSYSVVFKKEDNILRKDLTINAKLGLKYIEPHRLTRIDVVNNYSPSGSTVFKSYTFYYKEGEFNKSLLEKFTVRAWDDEYYSYAFDYHNDLKDGNTVLPIYGPDTTVSTFQADSSLFTLPAGHNPGKINTTYTKSEGASLRIGILMDFVKATQSGYGNIILASMTNSTTGSRAKGAHQLIDFNGDGILDILSKKNSGLYLRPGMLSGAGNLSGFGNEIMVQNLSSNFAYTETKEKARGRDWGGGVSFMSWSIYANTSKIRSSSKSVTPTYLIDANSDGVMDVVDGKDVWFNSSQTGTPTFTKYSENTENMVIKANTVNPETVDLLPKDDVVKFWIAPKDGYIRISDRISIENVNGANAVYSVEVPHYYYHSPAVGNVFDRYYRVYLTKLEANTLGENFSISRFNDYFSQIKNMMPSNNQHNHLGLDSSDRIFIKSGDKVYIRLHQNEGDNYKVNSRPDIVYVDPSTGADLVYGFDEDEDGFFPHNGSYSTNFLLNNHEDGLKLTQTGNITINVPAININPLNDDVNISFVLQSLTTSQMQVLNTQSYSSANGPANGAAFSINASINEPSVLMCIVESVSHKNYKNTGLNDITVNYTTGGNSYTINLVPRYNSYYVKNLKPKIVLNDGITRYPQGDISMGVQINKNITGLTNNIGDFSFVYVVKKGSQVLGKRKMVGKMTNGAFSLTEMDYATNQVINGVQPISFLHNFYNTLYYQISIQLYFESDKDRRGYENLKGALNGLPFYVYMNQNVYYNVEETSYNLASFNPVSKMYKNWGQFLFRNEYIMGDNGIYECIWSGTCDNYGILIGEIHEPSMNINTSQCNQLTDPDQMQACVAQNSNMYMPDNVFPLTTLKAGSVEKWKGVGAEQYSSASAFKDDEYSLGIFNPIGFDADPPNNDDTTVITPNSNMTTMKAADKIFFSSSETNTYSGSASAFAGVGVNLGYSESHLETPPGSVLIQDFTDLNGDGYPDFISKNKIQLTYPTGGHKDGQTPFVADEVTHSNNYQKAITASANFNAKIFKTTGSNAKNGETGSTSQGDNSAPWSPDVGVNSSYNFDSKDKGDAYWMDLNGDGLIDRVIDGGTSGLNCSLNYGTGVLGGETFYNSATYSSYPIGSAGISFGGSLSSLINVLAGIGNGFGINVSAGNSKSTGTSEKTFEDINGDGLVDILTVDSGVVNVNYNVGNKFLSQAVELKKGTGSAQSINFAEELENYNGYASIGGAFYIPIGPIPIIPPNILFNLWIKVGLDISGNIGMTMSQVKKAFKDVNGDGYTDLVRYEGDNLIINYSRIGKTNKLKQVTNLNSSGTFTIDYKFTTPDYNDPNARLVMTEVKVLDPDVFSPTYTTSNAAKNIQTKFVYENGKYDRRERQFLGFGKVTTEQYNAGALYRKNVDTYYNKSYHTAGLLHISELYTAANALLSRTENKYTLHKFNANNTQLVAVPDNDFETFDAGGKEGRLKAVVLLSETQNRNYEGGNSLQNSTKMTYDGIGRLTNYQYSSPSLSYNSEIDYHQGLPNNILNAPQSIDVYEGPTPGGNLLRHRETQVNNEGDIIQVKVDLNGSEFAYTDLEYDNYGNVKTIYYPENEFGERYYLNYEYDPVFNKYVTHTSNSWGESSSAEYDSNFDVPTLVTDASGNTIEYQYDAIGRISKVLGPKEQALPPTTNYGRYTVLYNYNPGAVTIGSGATVGLFKASTLHYNADNPNNPIETISFADAFGKVVQVKKDIDINGYENMSVSGMVKYDVFGRALIEYQPNSEGKNPMMNDALNFSWGTPVATMQYDEKDRVVQFTDANAVSTLTSYSIENGLYKTTTTIPSANQKTETFSNADGRMVKKNNYLNAQALTTIFEYNTTGELLTVTDPENISTHYGYDRAGRRELEEHPDHGVNRYTYDPAGHLIRLTTSNLENDPDINNHFIKYTYSYNRLTDITLPDLPNGQNPNNVSYKYGAPGSGNDTGKLIYKRDGTGDSYYSYGNLGEMIREVRTVFGYNMPTFTFNTQFTYDSWSRLKQLIYPDGETLAYTYDFGGNLKSVSNGSYEYIKEMKYDLYEQKQNVRYGNETKQYYNYGLDRRLYYYSLMNSGNNYMLNNTYEYDPVGNIKKIKNEAQVLPNGMGGMYLFNYYYDTLNRLTGTDKENILVDGEGIPIPPTMNIPTSNTLSLEYNNAGGIANKTQHHEVNSQVNPENTYNNEYGYISGTHMLERVVDALTGNLDSFYYDYNGNVKIHETPSNGARQYYWDEQDRMKAYFSPDNGIFQYYVYDDKGERTIKYNLLADAQLYQNGTLVDPGNLALDEFKIYPNPYVVVCSNGQYTKNYFEGSNRFASRIVDGIDIFTQSSTTKTQSSKNDTVKPDVGADFKAYLKKAGIENEVLSELSGKYTNPAQPGLYYLHGDHLGTASFVTDETSESTQFFLNLPFGETMYEQQSGVYDNPYKFNAKELDQETGLYYYGARYYNPKFSIWYGVDPLAEKYPSWSPYAYSGNNPINYIDPDGNFRLPANATKEERALYTAAIKTVKAVFRDSGFRKAFKERFKVDDKMIQTMLRDGDGPTVIMNESLLDLAHFKSDEDPNVIKIDSGLVNTISKHKGDQKYIDNLAEIIIHEGGHWADYAFDHISEEFTPGFRTSFQSKSGRPDAGDNWEIIYFGTDTQFSASDRDIITEKFDGIRGNNAAKYFRQQREIRDLKSQKKSSILDNYKKPKDNLRVRPCY